MKIRKKRSKYEIYNRILTILENLPFEVNFIYSDINFEHTIFDLLNQIRERYIEYINSAIYDYNQVHLENTFTTYKKMMKTAKIRSFPKNVVDRMRENVPLGINFKNEAKSAAFLHRMYKRYPREYLYDATTYSGFYQDEHFLSEGKVLNEMDRILKKNREYLIRNQHYQDVLYKLRYIHDLGMEVVDREALYRSNQVSPEQDQNLSNKVYYEVTNPFYPVKRIVSQFVKENEEIEDYSIWTVRSLEEGYIQGAYEEAMRDRRNIISRVIGSTKMILNEKLAEENHAYEGYIRKLGVTFGLDILGDTKYIPEATYGGMQTAAMYDPEAAEMTVTQLDTLRARMHLVDPNFENTVRTRYGVDVLSELDDLRDVDAFRNQIDEISSNFVGIEYPKDLKWMNPK